MNDHQIGIAVTITKFVDTAQPGFVECLLTDAHNNEWLFVDKVPIVTCEDLDETSSYPQVGQLTCKILSRRTDESGRSIILVDTSHPCYIESVTGETQFEVLEEQIVTMTW